MELLQSIEGLAPVAALKSSFYAYPLVNAAHILFIGMLLTAVGLLDLRELGRLEQFDRVVFDRTFRRIALFAFVCAAATGLCLFSVRATHYAANPAFLLKLGLIAAAVVNFLVYRSLVRRYAGTESPAGSPRRKVAVVSIVLWLSVLVCGRMIGFM